MQKQIDIINSTINALKERREYAKRYPINDAEKFDVITAFNGAIACLEKCKLYVQNPPADSKRLVEVKICERAESGYLVGVGSKGLEDNINSALKQGFTIRDIRYIQPVVCGDGEKTRGRWTAILERWE